MYNIEQIQFFAQKGLSINQIARKLKLPYDSDLRKFLKEYPDVLFVLKTNGLKRQFIGRKKKRQSDS